MSSDQIWPIIWVITVVIFGCIQVGGGVLPVISKIMGKPAPAKPVKTKDKMYAILEEGERKGCIKSTERKLVENIFDFKEHCAEDVMIHRRDVVMISKEERHEDIMHQILKTGLSRFPVYDQDADDVIGILAVRKYLVNYISHSKKNMENLVYPAYFVPRTVPAEVLLRDMQDRKTHIAVVVDEYGGVAGIVTLEDLLEEIVGNIYDEFDPLDQQEIIPISDHLWRVAGAADLEEVAKTLGVSLPEEDLDYDTMGGLVFHQLDIIPENGEFPRIEAFGMIIQVEHMRDRRISWVTVSLTP